MGCLQLTYLEEEESPLRVSWKREEVLEPKEDYYPFGLAISSYSSKTGDGYRFGYQGEYAEDETSETGFNAFQLRMYDPVIGRFVSADPARQYASAYVGMGNNPISLFDPTGGCVDSETGLRIPCPGGIPELGNEGLAITPEVDVSPHELLSNSGLVATNNPGDVINTNLSMSFSDAQDIAVLESKLVLSFAWEILKSEFESGSGEENTITLPDGTTQVAVLEAGFRLPNLAGIYKQLKNIQKAKEAATLSKRIGKNSVTIRTPTNKLDMI